MRRLEAIGGQAGLADFHTFVKKTMTPSKITFTPSMSVFGNAEDEKAFWILCVILARNGDIWRKIEIEEAKIKVEEIWPPHPVFGRLTTDEVLYNLVDSFRTVSPYVETIEMAATVSMSCRNALSNFG